MNALHVICKIGNSEYAIPAADVFQLDTFSGATPVPGAANFVKGLVQVRQKIIPVLDARVRFGLPENAEDLEKRIVVLKFEERLVGMLVDSAREVQNLSTESFKEPPELIKQQTKGFVKGVTHYKDRIIMLLDTLKIIGQEDDHAKGL